MVIIICNVWPITILEKVELYNYELVVEAAVKWWVCSIPKKDLGGELQSLTGCSILVEIDIYEDSLEFFWLWELDTTIWEVFDVNTNVVFNVSPLLNFYSYLYDIFDCCANLL